MYKMRLVTDNTKPGRLLKYKSLEGARKALKRIMGTGHPKKDPDGYAVGDNGQCLFFLDGLTFEVIFPKKYYRHAELGVLRVTPGKEEGAYTFIGGHRKAWIRTADLHVTRETAERAEPAQYLNPFGNEEPKNAYLNGRKNAVSRRMGWA